MKFQLLLISILLNSILSFGQSSARIHKVDSIHSLSRAFKRVKIKLGTDTLIDYRVVGQTVKLNSKNVRTISKIKLNGKPYYKVVTMNIPIFKINSTQHSTTTVISIIDYDDLHLIYSKLTAKTDSAEVQFDDKCFKGWSHLPGESKKEFDFPFAGTALSADANTAWIPGLFVKKESTKFALPYFAMFTNKVKWKVYTVTGKEHITIGSKVYRCWRINAGPQGPPGYTSFHWYTRKNGKFIKSELSKEGADLKFINTLKQ